MDGPVHSVLTAPELSIRVVKKVDGTSPGVSIENSVSARAELNCRVSAVALPPVSA
jgi:hypothetical protein